jgi:lycopene epsilon-cyclase
MELLCTLGTGATADFFTTFFRLPSSFWRGFLASRLSSGALLERARDFAGLRANRGQLIREGA